MTVKIDKQIKQYTEELKEIMRNNLSIISGNMINQIMKNYRNLPNSKVLDSIKNISPTGLQAYKSELLATMAVISKLSIDQAREEVPKAKKVKLMEDEERLLFGEFEKLPPKIRKSLKAKSDLLVGTQISDIEKAVFFQFQTSIVNDVTEKQLQGEMIDKAEDYIGGSSVVAGSSVLSARIVNEARTAFFFEPDVLEEIEAFQFMNGDPVSPICQELAGTIFRKTDPGYNLYGPPKHWNCKSWIRPILIGNLSKTTGRDGEKGSIEKLEPKTKKALESIQFGECSCGCH